jgi:dephospho-CoA kinase
MQIIGLTGGISTGKSTATAALREDGVDVIDLDEVARIVVEPGRPALAAIVARFGASVLRADGSLDRAALGERVFAVPADRRALNGLMRWPILLEVLCQLGARFAAGDALVVLDAPLLYEARMDLLASRVLVVTAPAEAQLARLMARDGLSREAAEARIAAQMPLAAKAARADAILDNSGGRDEAQAALRVAWARVAVRASEPQRRWPWARLPRARNAAVGAALWLAFGALRLAGRFRYI